jgi:hypothetical protein
MFSILVESCVCGAGMLRIFSILENILHLGPEGRRVHGRIANSRKLK